MYLTIKLLEENESTKTHRNSVKFIRNAAMFKFELENFLRHPQIIINIMKCMTKQIKYIPKCVQRNPHFASH